MFLAAFRSGGLWLRRGKSLPSGHTACMWQSQDSPQVHALLTPVPTLLSSWVAWCFSEPELGEPLGCGICRLGDLAQGLSPQAPQPIPVLPRVTACVLPPDRVSAALQGSIKWRRGHSHRQPTETCWVGPQARALFRALHTVAPGAAACGGPGPGGTVAGLGGL